MNLLSDIITYVRRIIKSPSNADISDNLIIDYINRFWIMDVDARMQLFDLKTKYQFVTTPGFVEYNMPLYEFQSETPNQPASQDISYYPVYQGFLPPAYIDGIQVPLQTQKESFFNIWPNIVQQNRIVGIGNGTNGPYTLHFHIAPNSPFLPIPINPPLQYILRGHVDITGIIANANTPILGGGFQDPIFGVVPNPAIPVTSVIPQVYFTSIDAYGNNIVMCDSGQMLFDGSNNQANYGLLITPGLAPYGNLSLPGPGPGPLYSTTQNTINYLTGVATNVYFSSAIPQGANINGLCFYFQSGLSRSILYYNNVITLRSPPDKAYLIELDAYLTPAAFFTQGQAIQFAYMCEYIARGAARKILSDTGDIEQFAFYEPLFKEQELLVWKRSQRTWTSNRTQTIYSAGINQGQQGFNNSGGGTL